MKAIPFLRSLSLLLVTAVFTAQLPAAEPGDGGGDAGAREKVLILPMRSAGPGSLDPVTGSTTYDNRACGAVYETLVQYKYFVRPLTLEPLLLTKMPESADRLTWTFQLKPGVRFQDDECFPGGKGRELVADDVFYSLKRFVDPRYEFESWWILKDMIAGLDEYKEAQQKRVEAGQRFDYDAPVDGFRKLDDHNFQIVLRKPVYKFLYVLAQFQTSVVPREAVEHYGAQFSRNPVGTGPYVLEEWVENKSLTYSRNPTFHEQYFPAEWMPEDEEAGLVHAKGRRMPFVDRILMPMFVEENPMWLKFKAGELDYTQVPAENYLESFHKRSRRLKKEFREKGITDAKVQLLDFIFRGYNMEDDLLGGYAEKDRHLRLAIHHATNLEEFDETFYNSTNILYDGMIPPGLDGYPPDGRGPISYPFDLELAKEYMVKAGYPGGEGLPVIDYYVSRSGNIPQQAELLKRQLSQIGVRLNNIVLNFPQLIETVNNKKAPFFSFAWSSDYPDGENNLALFYGPNEAPGSNHFNYKNPKYDALYEKIVTMEPSPERTKIYEQMRDMVMKDVPFIGSMARTRFYLMQPWLKGFKPTERFFNWVKYLDLDETQRP